MSNNRDSRSCPLRSRHRKTPRQPSGMNRVILSLPAGESEKSVEHNEDYAARKAVRYESRGRGVLVWTHRVASDNEIALAPNRR